MAVRLVVGIWKWLIDIGNQNITRMFPHYLLHLLCLSERFRELRDPQHAEQGQIRLGHQAQHITVLIDLLLHRPLGQAEKIHVAYFCQQDVLRKLFHIALHNALLFVSHGVRPPEPYLLSVQIKVPSGNFLCVHVKAAHSKAL